MKWREGGHVGLSVPWSGNPMADPSRPGRDTGSSTIRGDGYGVGFLRKDHRVLVSIPPSIGTLIRINCTYVHLRTHWPVA